MFRIFCRRASWLFDDPTCLGTCLSFWRFVRALYSATRLSRLNLLATFGACMGEAACDDTTLDPKSFATMSGRGHPSRLHRAVDCYMATWTFIFQPFLWTFCATAYAHGQIFVSMATFFFIDFEGFSSLGMWKLHRNGEPFYTTTLQMHYNALTLTSNSNDRARILILWYTSSRSARS